MKAVKPLESHSAGGRIRVMNGKQQRLVILDFYRFLAASAVVIYHISLHNQGSRLFGIVGRFDLFVDFFFILSGFVIARTYANRTAHPAEIGDFLRRRIARVYPLHLATLLLIVAAVLIQGAPDHPVKYSLSLLPAQILLVFSWAPDAPLQWNYPAWSISVEFAMYLLFPLMMFFHRKLGRTALIGLSLAGFLAMALLSNYGLIPPWDDNHSPIRALPTFTAGIIVAFSLQKVRHGIAIGAAALGAATALMMTGADNHLVIGLFILSIFFTAGGELANPKHFFNTSIVRSLGDASYSIYLLHAIVLMFFFKTVWKGREDIPGPIWIAALMAVVIVASLITYRMFEKPMRDWISGSRSLHIDELRSAGSAGSAPRDHVDVSV
jgi:peptidoglycan/LPS O-acetylase OafA/YrhL